MVAILATKTKEVTAANSADQIRTIHHIQYNNTSYHKAKPLNMQNNDLLLRKKISN